MGSEMCIRDRVGKEFNTHNDMTLYAATPPLEALRLILSIAATNNNSGEHYKIMTNDVSRAYFYAPVKEGQYIYVQLPDEDRLPGEEQMCGRLNFSMYGTRRAATNWQAHYTNVLTSNGFTVGVANNCTFYNESKKIYCMVHGDDFVSTATGASLKWFEDMLHKSFKIKTDLIGPGKDDKKELKVLNRIIKYTNEGIELEADLRHADLIVKQLGLENAKELSNPSADEVKRPDDEVELNAHYSTQYKSIVARANYLAADRPDIQFAVKKLATSMSKPNNAGWAGI